LTTANLSDISEYRSNPINHTGGQMEDDLRSKILELVRHLSDERTYNWTRTGTHRDLADHVLRSMAQLGIIQERNHKHGGRVWIFEDQVFGRTDGVVLPDQGLVPLE
jgi:hypothetical protein